MEGTTEAQLLIATCIELGAIKKRIDKYKVKNSRKQREKATNDKKHTTTQLLWIAQTDWEAC